MLRPRSATDDQLQNVLTSMPDELGDAFDEVAKMCSIIIAVASPVPCHMGSKYQDVLEILDDKSAGTLNENMDAFKTAIFKSAEWRNRIQQYWVSGLEDEAIVGPHNTLLAKLGSESVTNTDIKEAVSSVRAWMKTTQARGLRSAAGQAAELGRAVLASTQCCRNSEHGGLQFDGHHHPACGPQAEG